MIQLHAGFIKVRTQLHQGRRAGGGGGGLKRAGSGGHCVLSFLRLDGFVVVSLSLCSKKKNTRVEQSCALVVF